MTEIERESVVFHVAGKTTMGVPLGDHDGYIEWLTVYLHGHPKRQMSRCMLPIERSRHPECFSPRNSMTSMHVDVIADVLNRSITYTVY